MKKTLSIKLKIPLLAVGMFLSTNALAQNNLSKKDTTIFNYKISEPLITYNKLCNKDLTYLIEQTKGVSVSKKGSVISYQTDIGNSMNFLFKVHELIGLSKGTNYLYSANEISHSDYKLIVPVEKYGKSLIEKLTHKSFPNEISVHDTLFNDDKAGTYNYDTKILELDIQGSYSYRLFNFMHELGHAFDHKIGNTEDTTEIIRTEAVAFTLQFAAPYLVEDKKLKDELLIFLKRSYVKYYQGKEVNSELHKKAAQLADATITYFNDPIKAYNYLANKTYEEINSEIFKIINKNINCSCKKETIAKKLDGEEK